MSQLTRRIPLCSTGRAFGLGLGDGRVGIRRSVDEQIAKGMVIEDPGCALFMAGVVRAIDLQRLVVFGGAKRKTKRASWGGIKRVGFDIG